MSLEYLTLQEANNYYQQKFPKINKKDHTEYIEKFRSLLFDSSEEKRLSQRWEEIRDQGLFSEEYIRNKMKIIDTKINESVQLNAKIWSWNSKWYYDDNSYEKEKELFLEFVKLRLGVLDE